MNFSQRIGLEPATRSFQTDSMDWQLRNSLWNCFEMAFGTEMSRQWQYVTAESNAGLNGEVLMALWVGFFKWPLSHLPQQASLAFEQVHRWYFTEKHATWNKVYEFIEFVANLRGKQARELTDIFVRMCNGMLEREFSGYRFVGTTLTPITNKAEIAAIEEAAALDDSPLAPVSTHIEAALKLLADRKKPDYRNSMKESISAVEALCKLITGMEKATLGPALDAVAKRVGLHPRLQQGFKALYDYTSDDHGTRHGLKDDREPDGEDAKFMLVICSAFVNLLTEKARKSGLLPK